MAKKNTTATVEEPNDLPQVPELIKPTLLENEVPVSVGDGSRTIINQNGVEVEVSNTAAKILANMGDKTIKFVK